MLKMTFTSTFNTFNDLNPPPPQTSIVMFESAVNEPVRNKESMFTHPKLYQSRWNSLYWLSCVWPTEHQFVM